MPRIVLNHPLDSCWYGPEDYISHPMEPQHSSSSHGSYRSSISSDSSHKRCATFDPHSRGIISSPRNSNSRLYPEDAAASPDSSSSRPSTSDGPRCCYHPDCLDSSGRPKRKEPYSRKADLKRHVESTHEKNYIDCPFKRCERRGEHGFTRKDHLTEHLRGYHREDIPKRENGSGSRGEEWRGKREFR